MIKAHLALIVALGVTLSAGAFDLQGHRGARGLMPENTLPAYAKALELGVDTIECDMGITKDGVVVLHHDLWLNPDTTRGPDGKWLESRGPAIADLTFEELQKYDVGRLKPGTEYAKTFPYQEAIHGTRIPRMSDLFDLIRKSGNATVGVDCETKVSPYQPQATRAPSEFTRLIIAEIKKAGMAQRTMVQSFDWSTLQQIQREAPEIRTMYLANQRSIDARRGGVRGSPWLAGFDPSEHGGSLVRAVHAAGGRILSVDYPLATKAMVAEAKELGVALYVWTVNDEETIGRMLDLGVDGIISDRPDLVIKTRKAR